MHLKNFSFTKNKDCCMLFLRGGSSKPHYLCLGAFVMRSSFMEVAGPSQWLCTNKTRLSALFIPIRGSAQVAPLPPLHSNYDIAAWGLSIFPRLESSLQLSSMSEIIIYPYIKTLF